MANRKQEAQSLVRPSSTPAPPPGMTSGAGGFECPVNHIRVERTEGAGFHRVLLSRFAGVVRCRASYVVSISRSRHSAQDTPEGCRVTERACALKTCAERFSKAHFRADFPDI